MKQVHLFISGFVQGVGFRRFVRKHALKLGLTGWVTNLEDSRVEALIQGKEADLRKIIQICEKGSYFSDVKNVSVQWEEISEKYSGFTIIR